MTVRVRGIYATALTALLRDDPGVVQSSPAIDERFPDATFPVAPATVDVETTQDRRGASVTGDPGSVETVVDRLRAVGRDALAWEDPLPKDAIFAGEVSETLGRGAVVDLGADDDAIRATEGVDLPTAHRPDEGFLPFDATGERIEEGDRLLVQVGDPRTPWGKGRPVLDAPVRIRGSLVTLVRGDQASGGSSDATMGGPTLADLLPTDPPEGWAARWHDDHEEADLDALATALDAANERAAAVDDALASAEDATESAPAAIHADLATAWVWFGRESRFALDDHRREVTATMPGHHRVKAGAEAASAAVDFVEAICPDAGGVSSDDGVGGDNAAGDDHGAGNGEGSIPFGVLSRQFGPREGDRVDVGHGKPTGRRIDLGPATVTAVDPDGTVTLEREMSPGGTYDGLGVERRAGDVATTTVTEGRWWYSTVYRSSEGERRGTYVNVCTPVEVFPDEVRYVDLHVDVVKRADGTVERVDDDELDAAEAAGNIPSALAEKARDVASAVERAL